MVTVPNIRLNGSVGPERANNAWDVFRLQLSLHAIENPGTGQPFFSGDPNGRFDDALCQSMGVFASHHAIPFDGAADNNSRFLHLIIEDLRKVRLPQTSGGFLSFDGKELCAHRFSGATKCWKGVSGAEGFQNKDSQSIRKKGPVPEGKWIVKRTNFQKFEDVPFWNRVLGTIGTGNILPKIGLWPGGLHAWGRTRIWLEPKPGTNTFGRTGMAIHGGYSFGSAGCIDLSYNMVDFSKWFILQGVDMDLTVSYGK